MSRYFHSVTLDSEKCRGCTICIKRCPTEAIRVREGKAWIMEERCIDCGECIRICPNHAKIAMADNLTKLEDFECTVALPAPAVFSQFKPSIEPAMVLGALLRFGFNRVFEVSIGAEVVTHAIRHHIIQGKGKKPLISSACPAVIRLMQVRFPGLLEHIIPVKAPMEVAARLAKEKAMKELGLLQSQVGTFFITPCPAKVTAVQQPFSEECSWVDGVFSLSALYGELLPLAKLQYEDESLHRATGMSMGWGRAGGENVGIATGSLLSVDGIHSVVDVLEELEKGGLGEIDYIEAQACVGGCIGGPLVVQNPFVSRVLIRQIADKYGKKPTSLTENFIAETIAGGLLNIGTGIHPRPVMQLDDDIGQALFKMAQLEQTLELLPGLDCGSCGSPNCRALSEDIVRGFAHESDCIFKLRDRVRSLAEEMVELAQKMPPAMGRLQPEKQDVQKNIMQLKEIANTLEAHIYGDSETPERPVTGAYSSDLLDDTTTNAQEGNLWFTIQTQPDIVSVARLLNLAAIVITGGKEPDPETLTRANQEKVVILVTKFNSFEAAGMYYNKIKERK